MASDKFFAESERSLCPPSTYLRTDSKKMQAHGTVTYTMKSTLLTCLDIYAVVRVVQKVIVNNYAKICYVLERILFFLSFRYIAFCRVRLK